MEIFLIGFVLIIGITYIIFISWTYKEDIKNAKYFDFTSGIKRKKKVKFR